MNSKKVVTGIKRTARAAQNDTLDHIAYRYFGANSNNYLPQLIELNPSYTPGAILPQGSVITLPQQAKIRQKTTLKLWD